MRRSGEDMDEETVHGAPVATGPSRARALLLGELGAAPPVSASTQAPPADAAADAPRPRVFPGRGLPAARRRPKWFLSARGLRTRILVSYVVLLTISAVLSTFAIRGLLLIRLDDRVDSALEQEILEFERLVADGRDPETGKPFASLRALFDIYLARNVPGDEEAFLTFIDGEQYRSSDFSRFPVDRIPAQTLGYWQVLSSRPSRGDSRVTGTYETDEGTARFSVRRLRFRGAQDGAFAATILPHEEQREIEALQTYGFGVTFGILLLASGVAWLIAGRVLAPVQQLTETARSISQSDLTGRIEVRGGGEAADMASTFNAMLDRLETVFKSQREFIQDTSHELRDPLTICRGHLELLGDDPEERRETLALVLDEIDRMGSIVNDLQLLAEAEQTDFLRLEQVELATLTRELAAKARALAPRTWELDDVGTGTLHADRHALTEAMMNLANNAVQHTLSEDTVALGSHLVDGEVRLWVRDTGVGIPLSDQTRIFDRFTRGRGADRRYRGGGLGLAIVKVIAEAHGGRVELESRLGQGSTFTIVIPQHQDGDPLGENPDS
jgi:signal transduction histidine kinase